MLGKGKVSAWILAGMLAVTLSGCGGQSENKEQISLTTETETGQQETVTESAQDNETRTAFGEEAEEKENMLTEEADSAAENTDSAAESADSEADTAEEQEVTLVMVGDILLHTPVAKSGLREDGTYNFDAVFENVKERIESADLALVNEEVIIGGSELGVTGYPSFNAPYELGDALAEAGFDVVLHGTNHALDKGSRGLENCLRFWEEKHPEIAVLGINESAEAQEKIFVYEQDGIRIAILNYTYGTNGIPMPETMPYGVNLLQEEKVIEDLQQAEETADFVIVCPHWGTEYQLEPSKEQEKWVKLFADNGADLVIGTHPHVIEPVEWYEEEEREMLVYYSLGNFVNWTSGTGAGTANRMLGGMAEVTIGLDENGEVGIKEYAAEPLVCHVEEGRDGVTVYFLEEYTEELAEENEIRKQDEAFSLEYCRNLWEEVMKEATIRE